MGTNQTAGAQESRDLFVDLHFWFWFKLYLENGCERMNSKSWYSKEVLISFIVFIIYSEICAIRVK